MELKIYKIVACIFSIYLLKNIHEILGEPETFFMIEMQIDLISESRTRFSSFSKISWDSYTTFIKLKLSVVGWWMLESGFFGWEKWPLKSDW